MSFDNDKPALTVCRNGPCPCAPGYCMVVGCYNPIGAATPVAEKETPADGCHSVEQLEDISREFADSFMDLESAVLERPQFDRKKTDLPFEGFVPANEILNAAAQTFKERNAIYGNNYLMVGKIMEAMFPSGVVLRTEDDWNRYHLFELLIVKLSRFAISGLRHQDSIRDLTVYAAMVESLIHPESSSLGGADIFGEDKR